MDVTSFKEVDIQLSTAFTPLERIAIAADGNLQRIVRSGSHTSLSALAC